MSEGGDEVINNQQKDEYMLIGDSAPDSCKNFYYIHVFS